MSGIKVALAVKATDKIQLLEKVRTIEGLTDAERDVLLALINEHKTYGLVWEDKPEAVEQRLATEYPVLTEVCDRAIISDNPNAPNHILIEGDNIEALTTLAYTHAGKIDIIYIDPPYNTGNKDFIYNDSYVDSEDSYRHSKWLSFMSRRLRIAKKLLSERGVIFISIDDNEQANLKLLCDDIFGQQRYAGLITRKQSSGAKNDIGSSRVTTNADYIFVYSNPDFTFNPIKIENKKNYPRIDSIGPFRPRALEMQGDADTLSERSKMGYSVYHNPTNNSIKILFDYDIDSTPVYLKPSAELISQGYSCYRPRKRGSAYGRWRWGEETFIEKFNENLVHFENGRIFIKERAKDYIPKYPEAIWDEFLNTLGTNDVKEILGGRAFSFPKPTLLIKRLIEFTSGRIILDFFAGSGTTLHAVMQLNAEDGGKRTCILCTNNENGICENVTYERNKRVIQGYTKPNGEEVAGLTNNNLRYYRTEFVSRERTQKNRRELMDKSTDLLCIKEDLYTELPKFGRIGLNPKGARYFANDKKQMLIIYRPEFVPCFVDEIDKMKVAEPIKVYVYAPHRYAYDDEFAIVADKVSLCALPQNIIDVMARIMPDKVSEKTIAAAAPTIEAPSIGQDTLFGNIENKEA